MLISRAVEQMTEFYTGNRRDIAHFLKVWAWARTIAAGEGLSPDLAETAELAAIVHDIAIPLCREKYGSAAGPLQEKEGPALALDFLGKLGCPPEKAGRIAYLVGRHHTYEGVDGIDWQILLEADFLVNADEGNASRESVETMFSSVYRTATGKRLLSSVYLSRDSGENGRPTV